MSLYRKGIRTEITVGSAGTSGESACWMYNSGELWDGTSRLVVALHGHGGDSSQYNQNVASGEGPMALARTGRYVVLAIDAGGVSAWSSPTAMADIQSAVTAARNRGVKSGKYGLLGWSMGGLTVANKIKRDAPNIAAAWTWAPAIDLDYVYSTAGHVPIANNASWTSEVNSAFGSYAATAGFRVHDEPASYQGLGVPWKIVHATNDSIIPQSVSTSFVAAVNDPHISMRTPDVVGDHTNLFQYISDAEIVAHFDSGSW